MATPPQTGLARRTRKWRGAAYLHRLRRRFHTEEGVKRDGGNSEEPSEAKRRALKRLRGHFVRARTDDALMREVHE